jgi:AGZA family xanthine/uracil permease-like MFS transporter
MKGPLPIFVKRDLDGFFGLFVDNLVQLLLIITLCQALCGMTGDASWIISARILPGAAISLIVGNVFYAWQAHRVAARDNRVDVCALPYGINTPSLLVYIFFVMAPVYRETQDPVLAWRMGLIACAGSGVIELTGAVIAETVRKHTPRAALLSTLAGIAIGFISMTFALQIWDQPLIAMTPFAIILLTYFSRIRLPLGIPGGMLALGVGTVIAWLLPAELTGRTVTANDIAQAWTQRGLFLPVYCGQEILQALQDDPGRIGGLLAVIVPMGLFNLIGSLQNIESAEAAGDRYAAGSSLAVNGAGTILAAGFGSCFPTTIYIGHPGWKELGARAGYSTLNGLVITALVCSGTIVTVSQLIPIEAGIAIVLWIGFVITAQAFVATPAKHAMAVAMGLFPGIAAWGATLMVGTFLVAGGMDLESLLRADGQAMVNGFLVHGLLVMERGYILTSMILAAIGSFLIDRKFNHAAGWAMAAATLSWLGLMHAYAVQGNNVSYAVGSARGVSESGGIVYDAGTLAWGYAIASVVFLVGGLIAKRNRASVEHLSTNA